MCCGVFESEHASVVADRSTTFDANGVGRTFGFCLFLFTVIFAANAFQVINFECVSFEAR